MSRRVFIYFISLSLVLLLRQNALSQNAEHHFTSDFGFELSYPKSWVQNVLGSVPATSTADLDAQVRNDPQKRAIACNQKIFFTRLGEPTSYFVGGVETTSCVGDVPPLSPFAARTTAMVRNSFSRLESLERGEYVVNGQRFWVLRAVGVSRREPNGTVTVEYVATVLPQGLLYWSLEAHGGTARPDFEHARVRLQNGTETELLPAGTALTAVEAAPSGQPSRTNPSALARDYTASHHFKSELGFSLDVPQDMALFDVKSLNTAMRLAVHHQPLTPEQTKSLECARGLLGAGSSDDSRVITIVLHDLGCLGVQSEQADPSHFSLYTLRDMDRIATVGDVEMAHASIGGHALWISRASIASRSSEEHSRFLAMLVLPVQGGIVEVLLVARTRAELNALSDVRIVFDDGTEGALVPASAFAEK